MYIDSRTQSLSQHDFASMSDSDLRYHKYAELKLAWEIEHPGRTIPNGMSYTLHEQARGWADDVVLRKAQRN